MIGAAQERRVSDAGAGDEQIRVRGVFSGGARVTQPGRLARRIASAPALGWCADPDCYRASLVRRLDRLRGRARRAGAGLWELRAMFAAHRKWYPLVIFSGAFGIA